MCSRHDFDHLTDSNTTEPLDPYDESCDYCAKQVGLANLTQRKFGNSYSWMCQTCIQRQQERYAAMTRDAA